MNSRKICSEVKTAVSFIDQLDTIKMICRIGDDISYAIISRNRRNSTDNLQFHSRYFDWIPWRTTISLLWWISYVFDVLDVWFIEATAATYDAPISHHNYYNLKQWWLFAPFDNHLDRRLNVRAVTNKFIHDSNGTYECMNAKHL